MKKSVFFLLLAFGFVVVSASSQAFGQGVMLRGVGAVNESMGGAATACPLDAAGAINWNPASLSGLKQNEISFGFGMVIPNSTVSSSLVNQDGVTVASGSTNGQAGSIPAPNMAFVWRRCPKAPTTFGIGMSAVGGAATLYPSTGSKLDNPVLGGLSKSSTVVVMQMTPTVAHKLTDRLSVGFAPVIDIASLSINPMQLGQPVVPEAVELHNYGTRYVWGAGFQVGAYYDFKNHFKAGFMYKSPLWAESVMYHGTNTKGEQTSGSFNLNLPATISAGVSYDGFKNTILAMDVRYFDYANTNGFRYGIKDGKVQGLDWNSVISVALGVERTISKKIKVRAGYCWNENPIPSRSSYLNVAAPMMIEHALSIGGTYTFAKDLDFTFAYTHAFNATSAGNFPTDPRTGLVGYVKNEVEADLILVGLAKRW